jgi:hypothetical protein
VYPFPVPAAAKALVVTLPSDIAVAANFVKWTGEKYILASPTSSSWNYGTYTYDISAFNDGNIFVGMVFRNQAGSNAVNTADRTNWAFEFTY